MIISMTGYGKGVADFETFEATVEIKSVNHRFLDVAMKLPKIAESGEHELRDLIKSRLTRGRVTVNLMLQGDLGENTGQVLDEKKAKGYTELLESLRTISGASAPIDLSHLLMFPDIFKQSETSTLPDEAWSAIKTALSSALDALNRMRKREGEEVRKDLEHRIQLLTEKIAAIEEKTENRSEADAKKLYERIDKLLQSNDLDEGRLEMEVAILADRLDVTEECIRFKSHNTLFLEAVVSPKPAGRKLNFLLQEMNREANTIGAKANDAEIAHIVVEIKEEVEKLREQIQNIE